MFISSLVHFKNILIFYVLFSLETLRPALSPLYSMSHDQGFLNCDVETSRSWSSDSLAMTTKTPKSLFLTALGDMYKSTSSIHGKEYIILYLCFKVGSSPFRKG